MLIRDFPKPKKKTQSSSYFWIPEPCGMFWSFPPKMNEYPPAKGPFQNKSVVFLSPSGATVQYVSFRGSRGFILPSYSGIILQGMIRIPMNQSVYWKYWNVILGGWANPNILSTVTQPPTFWNLLLERYLSNGMFEALQGHFAWLGEASTQFTQAGELLKEV